MVGLMIEQVGENFAQTLPVRDAVERGVFERFFEGCLVEPPHHVHDPIVVQLPGGA
jgi:hypothetical protein